MGNNLHGGNWGTEAPGYFCESRKGNTQDGVTALESVAWRRGHWMELLSCDWPPLVTWEAGPVPVRNSARKPVFEQGKGLEFQFDTVVVIGIDVLLYEKPTPSGQEGKVQAAWLAMSTWETTFKQVWPPPICKKSEKCQVKIWSELVALSFQSQMLLLPNKLLTWKSIVFQM